MADTDSPVQLKGPRLTETNESKVSGRNPASVNWEASSPESTSVNTSIAGYELNGNACGRGVLATHQSAARAAGRSDNALQ